MTLSPAAAPSPLFLRAIDALDTLRAEVPDHERITDDEQGLIAAFGVSLRADCTRRRVGCVLTDVHGKVVGTGRNGAPPGRPGCLSAGACPRGQLSYAQVAPGSTYAPGQSGACIALHGEVNSVINSDPQARRGGTAYVTDPPCDDCYRFLAGSGLARVVWPEKTGDGLWVIKSGDLLHGPIGGLYG